MFSQKFLTAWPWRRGTLDITESVFIIWIVSGLGEAGGLWTDGKLGGTEFYKYHQNMMLLNKFAESLPMYSG